MVRRWYCRFALLFSLCPSILVQSLIQVPIHESCRNFQLTKPDTTGNAEVVIRDALTIMVEAIGFAIHSIRSQFDEKYEGAAVNEDEYVRLTAILMTASGLPPDSPQMKNFWRRIVMDISKIQGAVNGCRDALQWIACGTANRWFVRQGTATSVAQPRPSDPANHAETVYNCTLAPGGFLIAESQTCHNEERAAFVWDGNGGKPIMFLCGTAMRHGTLDITFDHAQDLTKYRSSPIAPDEVARGDEITLYMRKLPGFLMHELHHVVLEGEKSLDVVLKSGKAAYDFNGVQALGLEFLSGVPGGNGLPWQNADTAVYIVMAIWLKANDWQLGYARTIKEAASDFKLPEDELSQLFSTNNPIDGAEIY